MRTEQLSEAIGEVSLRYVNEAIALTTQVAKPRRAFRTGLVAAAIFGVFAIVAGAILVIVPVLQNYFGDSAQYIYQKNSQILNLSQTVDGWTMILTDCVGDDQFFYVGIEVTAPKGTVLDDTGGGSIGLGVRDAQEKGFSPGYKLAQYEIDVKNSSEVPFGYMTQLPDLDGTDNKLRFALWVRTLEPLDGEVISLTIGNIFHVLSGPAGTELSDFDGTWHFNDIKLNLADQTVRLKPNLSVPVLDTTATLIELTISPISVMVCFEGVGLIGQQQRYPNSYNIADPTIVLYDKQGNVMPLERDRAPFGNRAESGCDNGAGKLWIVESYETFIDLDALGVIEVCGISIPLP